MLAASACRDHVTRDQFVAWQRRNSFSTECVMFASPVARGNQACKLLGLRYASVVRLREGNSWTKGKLVNDGGSWR